MYKSCIPHLGMSLICMSPKVYETGVFHFGNLLRPEIYSVKEGHIEVVIFAFLQRAAMHCKRCTSYGSSVRLSVHPSVSHTPVLCQNDGT